MRQIISVLLCLALLAGCGNSAAVGIIGGADTPIIVGGGGTTSSGGETPASSSSSETAPVPESPPAPESSSGTAPASSSVAAEKPSSSPPPATASTPRAQDSTGDALFSLSAPTVKAGSRIVLTGENLPPDANVTVESTAGGKRKFFQDGDTGTAIIAVSRSINLGDNTLTVKWSGGSQKIPFTIVDAKFEQESFQMDTGVANDTVNSSTARDEYNRITAEVMDLATADPQAPNLDGFVMPVTFANYRISSSYGFTRIVNGKVSGRHEGVDFPAPKNTPVVAAGDGRVLYAGLMQMTGNTVIIEHGMGLKTWYQHLNSLDCKTGDILAAGDPVGKVGTTGYSTGNHLHFGVSVFDIYTDPFQYIPRP